MNLFNVILKTTRIRCRGSHPFRMITLGYLLLNPRHIDVNNKNKHVSSFLVLFMVCKICFFQLSQFPLCSELLGLKTITFKYIMHLYHLTFAKSDDITLNLFKL